MTIKFQIDKTDKSIVYRKVLNGTLSSNMSNSFNYPIVKRDETVKDSYFGIEVFDPYRWLENPDSEETKAFIDSQNATTRSYLDKCLYKNQIKSKVVSLWNYERISMPCRYGNNYFQFRNSGSQNYDVLYILDDYDSQGKVFLDPNTFSEDGSISLHGKAFSENGKILAYGVSSMESEWTEIKFRNVDTGVDYNEVLKKVKHTSMSWMIDNKGFLYGAYLERPTSKTGFKTNKSESQKLYYHQLDTPQSEDILVAEFDDPLLRINTKISHCGNYLLLIPHKGTENNLLYFSKFEPTMEITGKLNMIPVITELDAVYQYITNIGTQFYFRTNKGAMNYNIIIIDFENPGEDKWVNFIPEHAKDVLNKAKIINHDMLVLCYIKHGKNVMSIYDLKNGTKIHDFGLSVGTISMMAGKHYHKNMFYSCCTLLNPNIIHKVTFAGDNITDTIIYETKIGNFDSSLYEIQQVFYTSKDGSDISMCIVTEKGFQKDGSKACLLHAAIDVSEKLIPSFDISRLVFIHNLNGIFALADIRGGGKQNDRSYNSGSFVRKQNSFDDFRYAAKYLIAEKYTSPNNLAIYGRFSGGLLVTACANKSPKLFAAVICQAAVLDLLRYHKFTTGYAWRANYGCSEQEDQFTYLYKNSPLHNIQTPKDEKQYPAMLILTADHDYRVASLHSLKFIAELQHKISKLPSQTNPLIIRIRTRGGVGGKATSKVIDEITDWLCFISQTLNLEFKK